MGTEERVIKVGVVGAAGFAGIELVRLALRHPNFKLTVATSDALAGQRIAQAYPAFEGVTDLTFSAHDEEVLAGCELVFLAVPHTAALKMAPGLIARGTTVVDLSADFRLKDAAVYEKWYKTPHTAPGLLAQAAFGQPELCGAELAQAAESFAAGKAALVACAGCYPTATSLAAAPAVFTGLAAPGEPIVVDAISGVTGAGKTPSARTHYCNANENVEAYGVGGTHRHTPEIEQILGLPAGSIVFTPHLAPLNRGLLSTVAMRLADGAALDTAAAVEAYRAFYGDSAFVTVLDAGVQPKTASVAGTNRAQVGVAVHEAARMIIATCAIDNIGKGAAAQAVQCANIVCGLPEDAGLTGIACPI